MDKTIELSEKEINYIAGNIMSESSVLKNVINKNTDNVIGINTLSKEEKDRLKFLEGFLNKIRQ